MNMVSQGSASGYSLNYYDKSYQNYYTMPDVEEDSETEEAEEEGGAEKPEDSK